MDCCDGLGAWRQTDLWTLPEVDSENYLLHTFFPSPHLSVLLSPDPAEGTQKQDTIPVLRFCLPLWALSLVLDKGTLLWGRQRWQGRVAWKMPGCHWQIRNHPSDKGHIKVWPPCVGFILWTIAGVVLMAFVIHAWSARSCTRRYWRLNFPTPAPSSTPPLHGALQHGSLW